MKISVPTSFEITEARSGGTTVLRGVASVTYTGDPGTQYPLFPGAVERIAPGAFSRALSEGHDVIACFNHNADQILGRTPDTLRLSADERGLTYEVDLPDTSLGRDVKTLIGRGDLRGSSFAFRPTRKRWTRDGDLDVLLIEDLDLSDVSVVTRPAYRGTAVSLRSEQLANYKHQADELRQTRDRLDYLASLA